MDNAVKSFASNFAAGARSFGAGAASAARAAASDAAAAARDVRAATKAAVSGSSAQAVVGTVVTVSGRAFYVEGLLAEGGFGSVYTVSQAAAGSGGGGGGGGGGRQFVLKKMFAGSAELVRQLSAEVTLMQSLQGCAGVVRVLSSERRAAGGEGAEIYLIMELCPGGHLLARLNALQAAKAALPFAKMLDVFLQILRPVAYMHARTPAVAHRDLKVRAARRAARGARGARRAREPNAYALPPARPPPV
jgi:hypothetical protein